MTHFVFPPDQPVDPIRLTHFAEHVEEALQQLRLAVGPGQIFHGFEVMRVEDRVHVSPGLAFDAEGRAVALPETLALPLPVGRGPLWLVIRHEIQVNELPSGGHREQDSIRLDWRETAPTDEIHLPLAQLRRVEKAWEVDTSVAKRSSPNAVRALGARLSRLEGALAAEFSKIDARFERLPSPPAQMIDQDALREELADELSLEIWDELRPELSQLRAELEALADRPASVGPDRGGFTRLKALHGVGTRVAETLAAQGVETVGDLLAHAATKEGRARLTGSSLSEGRLRHLYRQADLLRLHGIGQGEVLLLEAVGVSSTAVLAQQEPRELYQRLVTQAERAEDVAPPALEWVESWVVQAQRLPPVVQW